jgi:hypothetical protein
MPSTRHQEAMLTAELNEADPIAEAEADLNSSTAPLDAGGGAQGRTVEPREPRNAP